jgi:hypothetical protein
MDYDSWFSSTFGVSVPRPGVRIACSWPDGTKWGDLAHSALVGVEVQYVWELLREQKAKGIRGHLVEFGIYQGWWVNELCRAADEIGLGGNVYGFDSFEGLSEPHPEFDTAFWQRGQYACSFEEVSERLQVHKRSRIKLIRGFFAESLQTLEAQAIGQFSYARIDCDIYEPAKQCLEYLGPRLVDGAILVFDDWAYDLQVGESRAFHEWVPTVPYLKFEFLFFNTIGHFYLRVHHR